MMLINSLIVDDEKKAREGLSRLLEKDGDISIAGSCKDGLEAIEFIEENPVELLFLDIQMPGINGFEVLNSLEESKRPATIFVTAYDQFALKAFEYHAVDYLLKPYSESRFYDALTNVKQLLFQDSHYIKEQIASILKSYQDKIALQDDNNLVNVSRPTDRLVIKCSGKILLLRFEEIKWIEGYDYYVKVHTGDGNNYIVKNTLKSIALRLPSYFMRIHKSSIVNTRDIIHLEHLGNNEYQVQLKGGQALKVSRTYKKSMDQHLGKYL